jgi:Permuted papain-like amidase enzyme, YaeF/YiiX, C92 family
MIGLQAGDILLVRGRSAVSISIEVFTGSPYSHAAIVMPALGQHIIICQAWTFGVELVPLEHARSEYTGPVDVYRLKDPGGLRADAMLDSAMGTVGRRYDYFGILRLAWLILTGRRTGGPSRKSSRLFCSQTVQLVYRAAGVKLTSYEDSAAEPGDLALSPLLSLVGTL